MLYTISLEWLAWKYKYFEQYTCTQQCNKHTKITHISATRKTVTHLVAASRTEKGKKKTKFCKQRLYFILIYFYLCELSEWSSYSSKEPKNEIRDATLEYAIQNRMPHWISKQSTNKKIILIIIITKTRRETGSNSIFTFIVSHNFRIRKIWAFFPSFASFSSFYPHSDAVSKNKKFRFILCALDKTSTRQMHMMCVDLIPFRPIIKSTKARWAYRHNEKSKRKYCQEK